MIKIYIALCFVFLLFGCSANEIKDNSEINVFDAFHALNLEGKADNYQNFNNLKKGDYDKVKKNLKRVLAEEAYLINFVILEKDVSVINRLYKEIKENKIEKNNLPYTWLVLELMNRDYHECEHGRHDEFKISPNYNYKINGLLSVSTFDPMYFSKFKKNTLDNHDVPKYSLIFLKMVLDEGVKSGMNIDERIYDVYGRLVLYSGFSPLKRVISLYPPLIDGCN